MKNILRFSRNLRVLLMFVMASIFSFSSCDLFEEEPPPLPDCEVYHEGTVTVKNRTGSGGYVDCTNNSNTTYDERWVNSYSSTTFKEVEANRIKRIWFSFDGDYWVYETEYLSECEKIEFTWTSSSKKSVHNKPILIMEERDLKTGTIRNKCEVEPVSFIQKE